MNKGLPIKRTEKRIGDADIINPALRLWLARRPPVSAPVLSV